MSTHTRSLNAERDAEICRLYADEKWTLEACGQKYGIKRQRVKQILKEHDIWRPAPPKTITERNTAYVGVFMTEDEKTALKEEADRLGEPVSELARRRLRCDARPLEG